YRKRVERNPSRQVPRLSSNRQVRQGSSLGGMALQRKAAVGGNSVFRHGQAFEKNWCAHHHSAQSAKSQATRGVRRLSEMKALTPSAGGALALTQLDPLLLNNKIDWQAI